MKWTTILAMSVFVTCGASSANEPPEIYGLGALLPVTLNDAPEPTVGAALPGVVDLRPWTVPIGQQGKTNSCVAWTIAYALVGWYANRNQVADPLYSPMFMYSQINIGRKRGYDGGAYPADGFALAKTQGNAVGATYSQPDKMNWTSQPSARDKVDAKFHTIKSHTNLFSNPDGSGGGVNGRVAIMSALAQMTPVAIAMRVRPEFAALSSQQPSHTKTTGIVMGNHAVLAVGYDTAGLLVQNHWGENWGVKGFGHIAWEVVEHDVFVADTIVPNDVFYNTVYRFSNAANNKQFYTLDHVEGVKAGYRYQGVEWRTMTTAGKGRREIFRCYIKGTDNSRFISIDPSCERQTSEGTYGFVYSQQYNGTIPLYRYYSPKTGERMATLDTNEGNSKNYRLEMILGYVTH